MMSFSYLANKAAVVLLLNGCESNECSRLTNKYSRKRNIREMQIFSGLDITSHNKNHTILFSYIAFLFDFATFLSLLAIQYKLLCFPSYLSGRDFFLVG